MRAALRPAVALALLVLATDARAQESGGADGAIAVVVDRDNPRDDVSLHELRAMFLGKRHEWDHGVRVVPLDLAPGSAARATFQRAVLGMEPGEVAQYWAEAKVRGEGTAPKEAPSAAVVVKLVARVRGAVGYVPLAAADATVKVLKVDGVAPGQPGYPIRRR